ncbi:regulatory LuxR family protein [Streptomyces sp. 3212.3]|uniref:response regulator transcription factor n=1 Tax=Streptomyces sp. 3212.3 TaxID=1938846 RepID=UPI000E25B3D1|nr:helix-turn-helix transcriptional regulator [Streptomyces sp. 3212.3]REE62166.1 regulatory LuxR family protein [Streptomyces sp. 3212.3]
MSELTQRLVRVLLEGADELHLDLSVRQVERLAARAAAKLTPPQPEPPAITVEDLSHQQLTVLLGLAAGERTPDTARRLWVSDHTVRAHRNRLFQKLGVRTAGEAVARAKDLGLLRDASAPLPLPGQAPVSVPS